MPAAAGRGSASPTAKPVKAPADDPIALTAAQAKERLRRQHEAALAGLDVAASPPQGEAPALPASEVITPRSDEEVAALRREVEALRQDLEDAVGRLSREMERAERVAADRARKEARRQGRKSERAARRAAQEAVETPEPPS